MPFVVYFFVLLITAGSVAFGLDWAQAPMSPMPASKYELHAAKAPEPPKPALADTRPQPEVASKPIAAVAPPAAPEPAPPPIMAPEPVAAAPQNPKCDIAACSVAYRSFTALDCTYQPSEGPRRLCNKGNPPSVQTVSQAPAAPDARAQATAAPATCNVAACSQAYISFSATDCTYQPRDGPRRLCAKQRGNSRN
jgi:hypothetical protein